MSDAAGAGPDAWLEVDFSPHERDREILGRRLHYVDYGTGPVVLLVHGLGGCWQWWLRNILVLGQSARVIAVDLPGFGDSEPLPAPGEMAGHDATLLALLDALAVDRCVLVGHSMGGLIAMKFAEAHPDRLDGLVGVCAGGIDLAPARLAAMVQMFYVTNRVLSVPAITRAIALRPRLRRAFFWRVISDPDNIDAALAVQLVPRMAAPGFLDAVRSAAQIAHTVDAASIAVPTQLLWGECDPILPVAAARELSRQIADCRFSAFPHVGHCPMLEAFAPFNAELGRFVADTSGAGDRA